MIEAMLQSTNFLFRLDETSDPKWTPYVMANRLSYAIWDSMPDAELFAAAARGDLSNPQGVEKAARRMLDHPRAHGALDEFVGQWMRFDRILTASKDRRKFPTFTRETAVAMTEEARLFIGDLVWNDRNFMDLFTADYAYVNSELASLYGVSSPANEFDRVRMRTFLKSSAFRVTLLRHWFCKWRRAAHRHRNIFAAKFAQKTVQQLRSRFRVAERRRDAQYLQLRTMQSKRHSKRIINVVANIGINDDFFWPLHRLSCSRRLPESHRNGQTQHCKHCREYAHTLTS
jgi:hypothetical protein